MSSDPGDTPAATGALTALVRALRKAARRRDQRRLLVIAGDEADAVERAASDALEAAGVETARTTVVSDRTLPVDCAHLSPDHAGDLLGTTRDCVVFDARDRLVPNALGSVVGAVDGGGLLVLLTPPLAEWPDRTDGFDETLAVPPYDPGDVSGRFRRRLADTLRGRPGVALYDADEDRVIEDGATDRPPVGADDDRDPEWVDPPADARFPAGVYDATLTRDQREAVGALDRLTADAGAEARAAVVEADRGRGKSSAAGLAAGAVAAEGGSVLVTAPARENAGEVLARAREMVRELDGLTGLDGQGSAEEATDEDDDLRTAAGGRVRYRPPETAVEEAREADLLVVDEAAALPVDRLASTLAADRVVYATTVHGYEGTGRGFTVRFRDRLAAADHAVTEVRLDEPVRYAADDPVERWAFDALLLDARPPVAAAVADATADSVRYERLDRDALVADRTRLRETFGLLARAHYRTEPDDLARLLDAPNVTLRALVVGGEPGHGTGPGGAGPARGHVVSVALLAREGGLSAERRAAMYRGERIRGHMVPDVLTSQLRDEEAGRPVGLRVLRIATHHAVRSRGLGSRLLSSVREEFAPDGVGPDETGDPTTGGVDYLGVGFGATPRLLSFWAANGYRTAHLSLTRNERSGEHSAVMLLGLSAAGRDLADRHVRWFRERAVSVPSGPLSDLDPDVVRAALHATVDTADGGDPPDGTAPGLDPALDDREWRLVAGAAYGPGLYQVRPEPFRRLSVAGLTDPDRPLDARAERLLVSVVLQARPVDAVAADLGYHSSGECLRAVGGALATLADRYGGRVAETERSRYE